MKVIAIDASHWNKTSDAYAEILSSVGAPKWNGYSVAAFLDALIWDELTQIKPPYTIQIFNASGLRKEINDELNALKNNLAIARRESIERRGRDVDVNLEIT